MQRLVPLRLYQRSEPFAPASPPPEPIGTGSGLLTLTESRNLNCGRGSGEHHLGQCLLVRSEPGPLCRQGMTNCRTACCLQAFNDHDVLPGQPLSGQP